MCQRLARGKKKSRNRKTNKNLVLCYASIARGRSAHATRPVVCDAGCVAAVDLHSCLRGLPVSGLLPVCYLAHTHTHLCYRRGFQALTDLSPRLGDRSCVRVTRTLPLVSHSIGMTTFSPRALANSLDRRARKSHLSPGRSVDQNRHFGTSPASDVAPTKKSYHSAEPSCYNVKGTEKDPGTDSVRCSMLLYARYCSRR